MVARRAAKRIRRETVTSTIDDQCEIDKCCGFDRTTSIFHFRFLPWSTFMVYWIKN